MKNVIAISLLSGAFLLVLLSSIAIGAKSIAMGDVMTSIVGNVFGVFNEATATLESKVIWNIRLPRVLLSAVIGIALAISGVAIQGLFRNPLADSGLIGISAGASLFAAVAILFIPPFLASYTLPVFAFTGALITIIIIYSIAKTKNNISVSIMLLGGIAITAIAMSIVGYLTFASDENELRDLTFWQLGSLGGATWEVVLIVSLVTFLGLSILPFYGKQLDAIAIGEANAQAIGVNTNKVKNVLLILVSLLVGVSVAFTGAIGFVGLVVPHIARLIVGGSHKLLFIYSAFIGGILLMLGDTIARTILAPSELPIGVITALIGAPVFIMMLMKNKQKFIGNV